MPPVLLANRVEVTCGSVVVLGARLVVEDIPAMPGWYYAAVVPLDADGAGEAAPAKWAHKWRASGCGPPAALGLWPRPVLPGPAGPLLFRMVHVLHSDAGDVSVGMKRRQPFTWNTLRAGCPSPWRVLTEIRFAACAEEEGGVVDATVKSPLRAHAAHSQLRQPASATSSPHVLVPPPPPPPPPLLPLSTSLPLPLPLPLPPPLSPGNQE